METPTRRHQKSSFRQIIFFRDCLKDGVIQPCGQGTNRGRVPLEYLTCKCVNLVLPYFHCNHCIAPTGGATERNWVQPLELSCQCAGTCLRRPLAVQNSVCPRSA